MTYREKLMENLNFPISGLNTVAAEAIVNDCCIEEFFEVGSDFHMKKCFDLEKACCDCWNEECGNVRMIGEASRIDKVLADPQLTRKMIITNSCPPDADCPNVDLNSIDKCAYCWEMVDRG